MMPQSTRGRVLGSILAVLALALVVAGPTWPEPVGKPSRGAGGEVLGTVVEVSAGLVAFTVALAVVILGARAAMPSLRQGVRTMRAWHLRRRARRDDHAQGEANEQEAIAGARPALKRTARLLVLAMAVVVVTVAVFALALNFDHGRELAELNGELGWRSHIWPLTIDGLLIAASLVGLVRRLLGLSVGFRARTAFVIGIIASAGSNIVLALHDPLTGWALAENIGVKTMPTGALLLTHEMGLQLIAYYARITDAFGTQGRNPDVLAAEQARAEAEARAHEVEQHANERVRQAQATAQQLHDQVRDETDRQLSERDKQLEHLRATIEDERTQHVEAQRSLAEQNEVARQEVEQVHAQLDELAHVDLEADESRDFERVAAAAELWVAEERRTRPYESLVAEVASVYGVSPRWVQKRVPQACQQRSEHDRSHRNVAQLAFAG